MRSEHPFFSKLNVRIAAAFLVLSLMITGAFALFQYRMTSEMLKAEDMKRTETSMKQSSEAVSEYLGKLKSFSEIIALHADIQKALSGSGEDSLNSIVSLIRLAKDSDHRIRSISVVSRQGQVITSGSDMAVPLSEDMMQQEWYQRALESSGSPVLAPTGHGVFEMDEGDWIVSICREIRGQDQSHLGIVIIDVSFHFIEDCISGLELGKEGYVYILSRQNQVIYHPDQNVLTGSSQGEMLQNEDPLTGEVTVPKVEGALYYSTDIPDTDWTMYGVVSPDNLKILQERLLKSLLAAILLSVVLTILLGLLLSHYISSPIIRLANTMLHADETWEHIRLGEGNSFEVKALANEYNHMIDRIRQLTENITKTEEERRRFEIRALQSQINPHFLYNTLDTILWLAELDQKEEVVNVTSSLGRMLRIALSNEQAFITLDKELEHTLSYLRIQKARYEDMLHYEINASEAVKALLVPKLILQPIVENAIYHGIRGKKSSGHICISCSREEEILWIEVEDDGAGFDPLAVRQKPEKRKTPGGIGMSNVEARIRLLCGEEYGLHVSSAQGQGTKVRFRLPVREG